LLAAGMPASIEASLHALAEASAGRCHFPPHRRLPDHGLTEEQVGFVAVVRAAPQLDVAGIRATTSRKGNNMMKLQEGTRVTSSVRADKRTAAAVTPPHFSPNCGRNVPRVRRAGGWLPRSRRQPALLLLQLFDESAECPVEYHRDITRRRHVPKEILRIPQLVQQLLRCRELNLVALGCQRGDHWPHWCRCARRQRLDVRRLHDGRSRRGRRRVCTGWR
jgi:hypothetical protein